MGLLIGLLVCLLSFDFGFGSIRLGKCPNPPTVENFDAEKYLGRWYEIESYGNLWERVAVTCPTADYSLNATTGNVIVRNTGLSRLGRRLVEFVATGTLVSSGKLSVQFTFPGGASIRAPYWVLGTDYDDWAVVWSCVGTPIFYADASWILRRQRQQTGVDDVAQKQINEILERSGIPRTSYTVAQQTNCQ